MNSKNVLSKIAKLLNLEAEVELTYAKLADGTIVESNTFDVGEDLFVVSEDGTKTPAPNGTHELMLKDSEGNETLFKVITEDGKIVERENVELAAEDVEDKKTEPLAGDPTEVNDVKDEKAAGEEVKNLKPSSMLSEVELGETPMEETETTEPIPSDTDKEEMGMPEMLKKIEDMAYRIEEMEKKISKMEEIEIEVKEKEEVEEEELPKLDGAPIEEGFKFSSEQNNKRFGKKMDTPQNSFLSKLYK